MGNALCLAQILKQKLKDLVLHTNKLIMQENHELERLRLEAQLYGDESTSDQESGVISFKSSAEPRTNGPRLTAKILCPAILLQPGQGLLFLSRNRWARG